MSKPTLEELRARVHGPVIVAGDDAYESARRVYNGMIDRAAAVIVRCTDAADVMATVEFAREHGMDLVDSWRFAQRARLRHERRRRGD